MKYNEKRVKVYRVRIDNETKDNYAENMTGYDILATTFEEAFDEVKKRFSTKDIKDGDVIGEIKLLTAIDYPSKS